MAIFMIFFPIIHHKIGISQNCFDLQSCYTPFEKPEKQEIHVGYHISHKSIQNMKIIKYKKNRKLTYFHRILYISDHLKIAISQNSFCLQKCFTPFWKLKNQEINIDYDRSHQSCLESKHKSQRQNGTFLSFHPLCNKA